MRTTNSNNSGFFAHVNTSPERSTHGKLRNSLNPFHISIPPTSTTTFPPPSRPTSDPDTNGDSGKISQSHTALSTSKQRSSGRRDVPSSHTSTPSVATSYASPAEHSTSFCNASSHNIQDNCPSHNYGATSTAILHTHRQTFLYTRPTTTLWASSTQCPNTALLMPSIL